MSLESDIKIILALGVKVSSAQSEAFEGFKQLQERIRSGESTGDRITDFVIANLGTLSSEAEKPYREMEARLRDGTGNQILVVERRESIHGCPGIVPPPYIDSMFIGIDTELRLGVLTSGLELDIGKGEIILPTERHVKRNDMYSGSKWELKAGPISFSWHEFASLGKEVHRRRTPMPNDLSAHFEHGLMLCLGSEVGQYFGGNRLLGASYIEALNLLGHEVPEIFSRECNDRKEELNRERFLKSGGLTRVYSE
ncbi:TPA: hypothetical protein H1009_04060 [archaeon]|nr:hypothetical protein [Candidatus Naiadarchaeales archaeon SRR2090153.bin461]